MSPADEEGGDEDPGRDSHRHCGRQLGVTPHHRGAEQLPPPGLLLFAGVPDNCEDRHQSDEHGA